VSTGERQLAQWLHATTPEPPRPLNVADVAARLAPPPRRAPRSRRWAPVLAAAGALLVVAVAAVVGATAHHPGPSAGPRGHRSAATSPVGSASAGGSASAASSAPAEQVPITGPWRAKLVSQEPLAQGSLVAIDNWMFAVDPPSVVRLSPVTGRILARAPMGDAARPLLAAGALWTATAGSGAAVHLRAYRLAKLAPLTSVTVPFSPADTKAEIVLAAGSGGQLLVGAGRSIAVVDLSSRRVIRRIQLPAGQLAALAVSTGGGKRLYAGVNASGTFELLTYTMAGGTLLASSGMADGGSGSAIIAAPHGVWAVVGSGMSDEVFYAPAADLARAVTVGGGGGGGLAADVAISGGIAWLGGSHAISCADPATGHVRASAVIPPDHGDVAYVGAVTRVGGRAFAVYLDPSRPAAQGLVRLSPPAACAG
jgi:hypothetical protein